MGVKSCEACNGTGCPIRSELSIWKGELQDEQSRSAWSTFHGIWHRAREMGCQNATEAETAMKQAKPEDLWTHEPKGDYYDPQTHSMKHGNG